MLDFQYILLLSRYLIIFISNEDCEPNSLVLMSSKQDRLLHNSLHFWHLLYPCFIPFCCWLQLVRQLVQFSCKGLHQLFNRNPYGITNCIFQVRNITIDIFSFKSLSPSLLLFDEFFWILQITTNKKRKKRKWWHNEKGTKKGLDSLKITLIFSRFLIPIVLGS